LEHITIGKYITYHPDIGTCPNLKTITYLSEDPVNNLANKLDYAKVPAIPTLYIPKNSYSLYVKECSKYAEYFVEMD
jgi:hypothetical protein